MRVLNILNSDKCEKGFELMRDPEVGSLKCKVVLSLMYLTGCYKVLNKSELKQFIYRSTLLFIHTKIADNYFDNGNLFLIDNCFNYWEEEDYGLFYGAKSQIKIRNLTNSNWEKRIEEIWVDPNKKRVYDWMENSPEFLIKNKIKTTFLDSEKKIANLITSNILKYLKIK